MNRFKFTKTALHALPLPEAGKRATVYDTESPKLAVRVTAAGSKTFWVIRRTGSTMAWLKLGNFPEMTVEQARSEAHKILGEFASGANPAAVKRAVRGEPSFFEVFERFIAEKKKRNGSHLSERTKRDYQDVLRLYLESIKSKKLSQITRAEIKGIHARVSKKSATQADRCIILVSSLFNFAADLELFTGTNPAARIQKNLPPERDRFALPAELPYLYEAIAESSLSDYFLLSLLTGARRSNVQAMAWRDIDLQAGVWRLDLTKNGTPQNVTLSPEAVAVLSERKNQVNGSPFVFPSTGRTGHLVEPKKAWATLLKRASTRRALDMIQDAGKMSEAEREQAEQLLSHSPATAAKRYTLLAESLNIDPTTYDMTDLRIHDLRRTLGSWQAKTGASMAIIGKSLNHKTQQATAIYARLDLDPVRQSVNTATQAMLEAAGIRQSADVVPINRNQ
ncbi:recombinase XerD [Ectopseudomonas toyotomiensis]|uniref:Site-specific recombinase XerD n=1 Tax=Ectopseudomonas toyotomiensis TaxID=554344 RepID=A0A1I5VZY4_9GAMM|nr:tyrosine-type recombinase/integrase [Pseudomonas toyotomiensis]PIA72810.1 recombinase XerD [Pseudomonas toyotomiensis]SFQ13049.1 Site-specific recombinase XerD [Pseudomonas toyotomiensis]